jgi:hypothetical protein
MGGQPGKPKPIGNPPIRYEPQRPPIEEPPKPILTPPVERPPQHRDQRRPGTTGDRPDAFSLALANDCLSSVPRNPGD